MTGLEVVIAPGEVITPEARRRSCSRWPAVSAARSPRARHRLGQAGALAQQWQPPALALHEAIKRCLDPKGLLNPGKKLARP